MYQEIYFVGSKKNKNETSNSIFHGHMNMCECGECDKVKKYPHLLEHLLMIIDEVAQLKGKTIRTLPVPESTRLMSASMSGPACLAADWCVKPNGGDTCLNLT